jgi:hypothetical protein
MSRPVKVVATRTGRGVEILRHGRGGRDEQGNRSKGETALWHGVRLHPFAASICTRERRRGQSPFCIISIDRVHTGWPIRGA